MPHLKEHWFPYLLGLFIIVFVLLKLTSNNSDENNFNIPAAYSLVPDINQLTNSERDNLIRYGKKLIDNTTAYLGPHGSVASISNGLNCQHCHRESGTKSYTNNFLNVASTYPKYRERSGRMESVEWRINECMQRSLNGEPLDSLSKEMKAMVAYIKWTGKNVTNVTKVVEAGSKEISLMSRAADPYKGQSIYAMQCKICHGDNGEGISMRDSSGYIYPPLWGEKSYAVSAGMYRLSKLASFIKHNMPIGATYNAPMVTDEEAWDLAAYINSQPHPAKMFATDWPVIKSKPVDYPFGPYADGFSEKEHKYGPFLAIQKAKKGL